MSTKKRFYIEIYNDWGKLRDRSSSASEFVTGYPLSDRPGIERLKELCILLNKGWQATEKEAEIQRLHDLAKKVVSGEIEASNPIIAKDPLFWELEQPGTRFYRVDNFNGWSDQILIVDRENPMANPMRPRSYQVAAFHVTACSDEELQKILAYVDELIKRLNEATEEER